jgi:hypothetical protein
MSMRWWDVRSWGNRKGTNPSTDRFFAVWLKSDGITEDPLAGCCGNSSTILDCSHSVRIIRRGGKAVAGG